MYNVNTEIFENKHRILGSLRTYQVGLSCVFPSGSAQIVQCQPYKKTCHSLLPRTAFIMFYKLS